MTEINVRMWIQSCWELIYSLIRSCQALHLKHFRCSASCDHSPQTLYNLCRSTGADVGRSRLWWPYHTAEALCEYYTVMAFACHWQSLSVEEAGRVNSLSFNLSKVSTGSGGHATKKPCFCNNFLLHLLISLWITSLLDYRIQWNLDWGSIYLSFNSCFVECNCQNKNSRQLAASLRWKLF